MTEPPEYFHEPVDIEIVERAGENLSTVVRCVGFEAYDVYDELLAEITGLARRIFEDKVCGVESTTCVGYSSKGEICGDIVRGDMVSFVGLFERAEMLLAPVEDERDNGELFQVPGLVFEPFDSQDLPEAIYELFPGGASLYDRVGVPLVGSLSRYVSINLPYLKD